MFAVAVPLPLHAGGQTCVWMDAGILAYRLCDRAFDCENCPLDAALRGARTTSSRGARSLPPPRIPATTFPDDRFYSTTHTWVQRTGEHSRRVRVGLDAFAAPLIRRPWSLLKMAESIDVEVEEPLAALQLDEGRLVIGSPVHGRVGCWNPALAGSPWLLVSDSYGAGWLVELTVPARAALAGLLQGEQARRQARFDARRYRRRLAYELLSSADEGDLPGWSESGSDLSGLLGPARFLSIVRELIH